MHDWTKGWMNTVMVCPKGCGVSKGFVAEDYALSDRCPICSTELEGFRILKRETA
jgi:rubrerythrin